MPRRSPLFAIQFSLFSFHGSSLTPGREIS
jgi:hypothetical protein